MDKWISVKDRLPFENGDAIISCIVFDKCWGIIVRPYNEYHKCWDTEDQDDFYQPAVDGTITHWMPLPEPPKIN